MKNICILWLKYFLAYLLLHACTYYMLRSMKLRCKVFMHSICIDNPSRELILVIYILNTNTGKYNHNDKDICIYFGSYFRGFPVFFFIIHVMKI